MSTSKKKTTRKRLKAGSRRKKGSTRPYTRFSTMTTQNIVAAAVGVQVFAKVTSNIGDNATEGALFRRVTNTHATLAISLAETQALSIAAGAYKLMPGQSMDILGHDVGWAGDLWCAESTGVASLSTMSF